MIFAHTVLTNLDVEMMREFVEQQVRRRKARFVFLGFLSIAAGGAAAALPGLAALNTENGSRPPRCPVPCRHWR